MSDTAIRVENLGKMYRIGRAHQRHDTLRDAIAAGLSSLRPGDAPKEETIWALKDVSFEVKRGEVLGVIGRNGAGKSTLLKILSRITEPTTGRAEIHGRVGSLLEVGTGFHPELTGRENIYLNGAILGMRRSEIARRFDEIVAFAEIDKFLDTPVKHYSSGMYVRLAFAVAAHLEPEILLVDEVLAVGDAQFQKKCLGKMEDVAGEGRTVLFVSHNLAAVQTLCRRAIWLELGTLRDQGSADQAVTSYLHASRGQMGTRELVWPKVDAAPGNSAARLHRISIKPEAGTPSDPITTQTPFCVEVEYWNLLPSMHLHATLHFVNEQGIVAFTASSGFDPDETVHEHPPAGLFRTVCHIPSPLLNSGSHRIAVFLVRADMSLTCRLGEMIEFDVIDDVRRKFAWFGREPGVVQPKLRWDSSLLSEL